MEVAVLPTPRPSFPNNNNNKKKRDGLLFCGQNPQITQIKTCLPISLH